MLEIVIAIGVITAGLGAAFFIKHHHNVQNKQLIDEPRAEMERYATSVPSFNENEGFLWNLPESNIAKLNQIPNFDENKLNELEKMYPGEKEIIKLLRQEYTAFVKLVEFIETERKNHPQALSQPDYAIKMNKHIQEIHRLLKSLPVRENVTKPSLVNVSTVLMLTHEFNPKKAGGVATVVQMLSKYLKDKCKVDVIERSIESSDSGIFYYYPNAGKTHTYSFREMSSFLVGHPQLNFNVLHVQSINFAPEPEYGISGAIDVLQAKFPRIPTIYTAHSIVAYEKTKRNESWMDRSILYQNRTIEKSQHYIVLHRFGKELLKTYYPHIPDSKISIIPNGIELDKSFFEKLGEAERKVVRKFRSKIVVLYVGRLSKEKGLEELIEALPDIRKKHDVRLVLVGPTDASNAYYAGLQQKVKNKGITAEVIFAGGVSKEEQIEKVYKQFNPDMAILPSHHESFPMFALEAVSQGVPLLVTDVDGPREIYSPFRVKGDPAGIRRKQELYEVENPLPGFNKPLAIAVDPKNPQSIVDAVIWTIEHPKETHTILKNAMREIKTKYNWEAIAEETARLYQAKITGTKFVSKYDIEDQKKEFLKAA